MVDSQNPVKRFFSLFSRNPKTETQRSLYMRDYDFGASTTELLHRHSIVQTSGGSIVAPLYNRCAIDVASLSFRHVRVDEHGNYLETIKSKLNDRLTLSANPDQTGFAFMQDVVYSLFDDGVVAIVPVVTSRNPYDDSIFEIFSFRTGRVVEWYPDDVRVEVFNKDRMQVEEVLLPKKSVALVENPLYPIMNEPNSTLRRLKNKLYLLDVIDEESGSGKLDVLIQLAYAVKHESKKKLAEERLAAIEEQLANSRRGIAYIDGTEKVIQLNRPAANNLMEQIEYLTRMLYNQLGLTEALFNGTASEGEYLNYYNRLLEPVSKSIVSEMKRKFLSKTAITQGQSIEFYRNPFSLVNGEVFAELSDKLTRNEIVSANEIRAVIGMYPSKDPKADELRNSNIAQPKEVSLPENDVEKGEKI